MAQGRKCRITVLKCGFDKELSKHYAPNTITCACDKFKVGQEFVLDQNGPVGFWHLMGGNFCSEAWSSIGHYVDTILQGGSFQSDKGENKVILSCPNGIKPVVFKIEPVID